MPQDNLIMQEDFDSLLSLLSLNREEAGAKYEEIRKGLIRYFYLKGCADPETLADETINRASTKFSKIKPDQNFQPRKYFYAIAGKIFLEYLKKEKNAEVGFIENRRYDFQQNLEESEFNEKKHLCLKKCLEKISTEEREIIIGYFSKEGGESIKNRRKIAERFNLRIENLHIKIYRLKKVLRNCVENCVNQKSL